MIKRPKTIQYPDELDFSIDSRLRETLLEKIKSEYFGAIEDDELDFLNAAGPIDEGGGKRDRLLDIRFMEDEI